MPPTTKFTAERILTQALGLLRQEGVDAITARNLAAALGCSTAPLFTRFASMEELLEQLMNRVMALFFDSLRTKTGNGDPLEIAAHGWLRFAAEEPRLYEALFLRAHPWHRKWGPVKKLMAEDMANYPAYADLDVRTRLSLIGRVAIVMHGLGLELWSGRLPPGSDYGRFVTQLAQPVLHAALAQGWSEDLHSQNP